MAHSSENRQQNGTFFARLRCYGEPAAGGVCTVDWAHGGRKNVDDYPPYVRQIAATDARRNNSVRSTPAYVTQL